VSDASTEIRQAPSLPLATRLRSNAVLAPAILAATALFGSASLFVSLWDRTGRRQHRIAQAWARTVLRCARSHLTVVGAENLLDGTAAVYACNHLSYMDTPAIFAALPFQFRILARSDLWKIPFIGWHLRRSGQIPVNAENPRSSIASLNRGIKALREGMPLVVFPEGGRTRNGALEEFMSGPAYMAARARVPLVPMALVGTYAILPIHARHLNPGPIRLVVGPPMDAAASGTRSAADLTRELREAVSHLAGGAQAASLARDTGSAV
jgi:1-acyl-sn-glycerol-3-phosphate acyltransferase